MIGKAHPALQHIGHGMLDRLAQHLVQVRPAQVQIDAHHPHVALALEAEGEIGQRGGLAGRGIGRDDRDPAPAIALGLVDDLGAQKVVRRRRVPAFDRDHAVAPEGLDIALDRGQRLPAILDPGRSGRGAA